MTASSTKSTSSGSSPVPVDIKLTECALTINAKCGSCLHFSHMAHPAYGAVCKMKGVLETSKPCKRFAADFRLINMREQEDLQALAQVLEALPTDQLPLVAALINRESRTRKRGFWLGMLVYLRPFGGDYISNYRKCRVIAADRNYVQIQASDGWTASVFHDSVLKPRDWKRKKLELEKAGRIKDPNYKRYFKPQTKADIEVAKFHEKRVSEELAVIKKTGNPLSLDKSHQDRDVFITHDNGGNNATKRKSTRHTPLDELLRTRG